MGRPYYLGAVKKMGKILFSGSGKEKVVSAPTTGNSTYTYIVISVVVLIATIVIVYWFVKPRESPTPPAQVQSFSKRVALIPDVVITTPEPVASADEAHIEPVARMVETPLRDAAQGISINLRFPLTLGKGNIKYIQFPQRVAKGQMMTSILNLFTTDERAGEDGTIQSILDGKTMRHEILSRAYINFEHAFQIEKPEPWEQSHVFTLVLHS